MFTRHALVPGPQRSAQSLQSKGAECPQPLPPADQLGWTGRRGKSSLRQEQAWGFASCVILLTAPGQRGGAHAQQPKLSSSPSSLRPWHQALITRGKWTLAKVPRRTYLFNKVLAEHLLCARQCSRCWGTAVSKTGKIPALFELPFSGGEMVDKIIK